MCCGTDAGSYLRLKDSCITQLKAQGLSKTCEESGEEESYRAAEDVEDAEAAQNATSLVNIPPQVNHGIQPHTG